MMNASNPWMEWRATALNSAAAINIEELELHELAGLRMAEAVR